MPLNCSNTSPSPTFILNHFPLLATFVHSLLDNFPIVHPIPCQELRMRQSYNAESFYDNKVRYVEHLMLYFLAILQ